MSKTLRSWLGALSVPVLATIAGLIVGILFIVLAGADPIKAYGALWQAIAGSPRNFGETLVSTIPLIFTGLAVALAFRCGLFNIGVEGQYLMAMLATAWAGYALDLPGWLHPTVCILFGIAGGAIWAGIVGVLKAYRGVHEVINSIMLNYVALYLTHWVLITYMKAPNEYISASRKIATTAAFTQGLIPGSRLHAGLWIALAAALLVWVFLWKTPMGYEIRAVGFAPGAAEYAGISVSRNIVLAMVLSGVLSGLAGGVQVLGIHGRFYEQMGFSGYGFDGIAVALVGRNHPVGVVLAALLFGALSRGGPSMQAIAGVPKTVIWIVQGSVIFFVAAEGLWKIIKKRRAKAEVKPA